LITLSLLYSAAASTTCLSFYTAIIMSSGPNLAHLLPPSWKTDIDRWYAEDTPSFDWGGLVVGEEEQEAFLWAKSGVSDPR